MKSLAASLLLAASHGLSCLDTSGSPVDWWVIMKLNGGLRFAYMDASTPRLDRISLTAGSLNDSNYGLGGTLQQLIDLKASAAVVTWNDEPPPVTAAEWEAWSSSSTPTLRGVGSGTTGHTNGVLAGSSSGGLWISHSMPLFPVLNESRFRWTPSVTYAQSFLCISLSPVQIEVAAGQVALKDVKIYGDSGVPVALQGTYPTLTALVAGTRQSGKAVQVVTSLAGMKFTSFAKSGSLGIDIYEDFVQPYFGLNFMWETWLRSPAMATYCPPTYAYASINVRMLSWQDENGTAIELKETQDHSKWGVSINNTVADNYLCIGDMNRMSSQWARGGGLVCFQHDPMYYTFKNSIVTADQC